MNKLKGNSFIRQDTNILLYKKLENIQIFPLVAGNPSSTCPAYMYKSEYL